MSFPLLTKCLVVLLGGIVCINAQEKINTTGGVWKWEAVSKYDEYAEFPSGGKKSWKEDEVPEKRRELLQFIKGIRESDPSTVKAFPSAADFPGIPADGTPLISKTLTIDPNVTGWHSTGLYALPGVKVTIKVPHTVKFKKDDKKFNYEVRIGCHTDKLSATHRFHKSWNRTPELSYSTAIKEKVTEITSPSGGLIYICSNLEKEVKDKPFKVEIFPAAEAPTYIRGKTKEQQWSRQLENSTVPWGEIVTPRFIATLPLDTLRKIEKIKDTAEHMQKGMLAQDWLAAWDYAKHELRRPMRFVVDRQISAGGGHAGYPTMGLSYWTRHFETGNILKSGHWGLWHELGHNHQRDPLRLNGMGEVTVNFYTLIAHIRATDSTPETVLSTNDKVQKEIIQFMANEEAFDTSASSLNVRLEFFKGIFKAFGFVPLRNVSVKFYKNPYKSKELDNQQKWDWFFITLCNEVKRDMSRYYELWKINISDETKKKVNRHPKWLPSKDYPRDYYTAAGIGNDV